MSARTLALFTLTGTEDYAKRVSTQLETPLSPVEERSFEDGEHKTRALVPVEGIDAYVVHALYGDETHSVNDKLCRLLFLIAASVNSEDRDYWMPRFCGVADDHLPGGRHSLAAMLTG